MKDADCLSELANKNHNDLRMLYQEFANQISFSKSQQWRITYYAILGLSSIVALSDLGHFRTQWKDVVSPLLIIFALIIVSLSTFYILDNELSMRRARRKLKTIYGVLSVKDTGIITYKPNYGSVFYDWYFWLPLTITLWIGFGFVFAYLAKKIGGGQVFWAQLSSILGSLATIVPALVLAAATIALWRSTNRYAKAMDQYTKISRLDFTQRLLKLLEPTKQLNASNLPLFSLGVQFQKDLNNESVSEQLRHEFKKNGFPVSTSATVSIVSDTKWAIVYESDEFRIEKDKDQDRLTVYMDLRGIPSAVYRTYGNLLAKWLYEMRRQIPQ